MLHGDIEDIVPDKKIIYKQVDGADLELHVFFPPSHSTESRTPAVVSFFGGGWKNGKVTQFYRQSVYWACRGMVAICADYRVMTKHNAEPYQCLEDAKSAIRWVRSNSRELGIDPERVAAAGGSAGGHLAVATAIIESFDAPGDDLNISCKPNALLLFNPVIDNGPEGYGYDRVKGYWGDFSPLHNIDKKMPPTLFMLGTNDKLIPVSTAKAFKEKVESMGSRCDLILYENQQHGFFNYERSCEAFMQTLRQTDVFLISIGYFDGKPLIE
jgi:acetyl esterase/lipase